MPVACHASSSLGRARQSQALLRLIALIKSEDVAKKILTAMQLPAEVLQLHPARPPPGEGAGALAGRTSCDPGADSLEAEWNAKLRAPSEAQDEYQRQHEADRLAVGKDERQRILALVTDFPAVWRDPNTPQRERKRMLALLIEDITLIKRREITVEIRFRGGATTT